MTMRFVFLVPAISFSGYTTGVFRLSGLKFFSVTYLCPNVHYRFDTLHPLLIFT